MVGFEGNLRHAEGGLDLPCSPTFACVLFVLETPLFCPLRVIGPCSVRCVLCFIAEVRRRCCTAFACTAVFEKRMEARIRRSFSEGAGGLLCRLLTLVHVLVVLAEQCADVRR